MMAVRSLRFILSGEDKSATKALDKVGKKAEGLGSKFGALAGGFAGGALGAGLASAFKGGIQGASDLSETLSKTRNIFGDNSGAVEKWSKGSAKSFGLSQQAALAAASQYGDMFKQLGFTGDAAVKASTGLVKTAADLGSFHNVDPSDVLDRIGGALRGEYDSLQQLIPNINAARVEQEALRATHKKSAKDLTAAEKATAVMAIVNKDGANAANDFAETAGGLANQQRILGAEFTDVSTKVAADLLPTLVKLAETLLKVVDFVQRNSAVIGPLVAVVAGLAIGVKAWAIAQAILNSALLANPIGIVVVAIAALAAGLIYAYKHSETFRNIVNGVFGAVGKAAGVFKTVVVGYIRFVANFWLTVVGALVNGAAKAFGWVPGIGGKLKAAASSFNDFKDKVNNSLAGINETKTITIKAVSSSVAEKAANAGIASGALSGSEAAASVTTRSGARAVQPSPVTVNVHVQAPTLDGRPVAKNTTQRQRTSARNGAKPAFGL